MFSVRCCFCCCELPFSETHPLLDKICFSNCAASLIMLARPLKLPWVLLGSPGTLHGPTPPFLLGRALAVQLPPPTASSLDQWLLSGRWSNLSHLPTHLSTAKTGAFCYRVAQMPGNLIPSVKEEAIGETAQHLVPCLLPFTC